MKQVIAIIRPDKMNETKRALVTAGIPAITARKVLGRGRGQVDYRVIRGAEAGIEEAVNLLSPGPRMMPKRILWISTPDDKKDKVVRVLLNTNRTGKPGDGKIFVRTLTDVVRIRTAETGDTALDEQT